MKTKMNQKVFLRYVILDINKKKYLKNMNSILDWCPYDLDLLNGDLETKKQGKEINQSGWSMQSFIKSTT